MMNILDIIHPDFREIVSERSRAGQLGEPVSASYEFKIITKSGEIIWVEISGGHIIYKGKPAGLATLFDITEHKKVGEEIAKLAFIVTSSDEAIIGKCLDGIITSWNLGAEKIYGYSADELIGPSISTVILPERTDDCFLSSSIANYQLLVRIVNTAYPKHAIGTIALIIDGG